MGTAYTSADEEEDVHRDVRHAEALLEAGALQSAILQRAIFNSANFSSIATDAKGVIQLFNVAEVRRAMSGRHVVA
jgi:hypothetical protein